MDSLEEARACIDSIDQEIARLFEERMNQSAKVADYKIRHALPIYDAAKEASKLSKNAKLITDPVIREYYISFQKSVMYESRAYQGRIMHGMKVSYCGEPGAFAHVAAHKLFPDAELVGYPDSEDAYRACEQGLSDVCVLPVENSLAGDVGMVMDLIYSGSLYVNRMSSVNTTRFAALSALKNDPASPQKKDGQFLLLFTVPNEAGALAKVLNIIGSHGFNMRNLRSRPSKSLAWSYYFFAELEGNVNSRDGQDLLKQMGSLCRDLKLAGTYSAEE